MLAALLAGLCFEYAAWVGWAHAVAVKLERTPFPLGNPRLLVTMGTLVYKHCQWTRQHSAIGENHLLTEAGGGRHLSSVGQHFAIGVNLLPTLWVAAAVVVVLGSVLVGCLSATTVICNACGKRVRADDLAPPRLPHDQEAFRRWLEATPSQALARLQPARPSESPFLQSTCGPVIAERAPGCR